jgi:hypothetical protein
VINLGKNTETLMLVKESLLYSNILYLGEYCTETLMLMEDSLLDSDKIFPQEILYMMMGIKNLSFCVDFKI